MATFALALQNSSEMRHYRLIKGVIHPLAVPVISATGRTKRGLLETYPAIREHQERTSCCMKGDSAQSPFLTVSLICIIGECSIDDRPTVHQYLECQKILGERAD